MAVLNAYSWLCNQESTPDEFVTTWGARDGAQVSLVQGKHPTYCTISPAQAPKSFVIVIYKGCCQGNSTLNKALKKERKIILE